MSYLIDTNILIYSIKDVGKVNENLLRYCEQPKFISVITLGELLFGAEKSQKRERSLATVGMIRNIFPILPIDEAIIEVFGRMKASMSRKGLTVDDMDMLIASTAIANNLVLATHNTRHFSQIQDLEIVDWF